MNEDDLNARRLAAASRCLDALAARWRGDWSDFDGRVLRDQLDVVQTVMHSDDPEPLADTFVEEQQEANDW